MPPSAAVIIDAGEATTPYVARRITDGHDLGWGLFARLADAPEKAALVAVAFGHAGRFTVIGRFPGGEALPQIHQRGLTCALRYTTLIRDGRASEVRLDTSPPVKVPSTKENP